jgi:hypothetical protein
MTFEQEIEGLSTLELRQKIHLIRAKNKYCLDKHKVLNALCDIKISDDDMKKIVKELRL